MPLTPTEISDFRTLIYDYYRDHPRSFPWRDTDDPYKIWVSEIMLQQTQAPRVVEKYNAFIAAFPRMQDLAAAPLERLLALWQGLGYNRRALGLQQAAKILTKELGAEVPEDPQLLKALPGIGPYTASAIRAFAFNRPDTFIETNIRRVFLHHFFPNQEGISDEQLMPMIAETVDRNDPRNWYYALMDYGAHLKGEVVNPNRRSRHYTKQSTFEGSDRQIRGFILREMIGKGQMEENELIRKSDRDPARVKAMLAGLQAEGFLVLEGTKYRIADSSLSQDR